MTRMEDILNKIRGEKSFIEGRQTNLPVGGQGESLSEVFDRYLDVNNAKPLANLNPQERGLTCLIDAYAFAKDETDIDGFLIRLVDNIFITSSSVGTDRRSTQLQNIAVGQMNKDFAMQMAQIKSGENHKELKDAI